MKRLKLAKRVLAAAAMASIAACSSSGNISKLEEKPDSKFDVKGLFDGKRAGEIFTAYDKNSGTVYAVSDSPSPSVTIKGKNLWGSCETKVYSMNFQPSSQINISVKTGILAEVKRAGAKVTAFAESKAKVKSSIPGFYFFKIGDWLTEKHFNVISRDRFNRIIAESGFKPDANFCK